MLKHSVVILSFLLLQLPMSLFSQDSILQNNLKMLDTIATYYLAPCVKVYEQAIPNRIEKKDHKLLKDLNSLYAMNICSIDSFFILNKFGYKEEIGRLEDTGKIKTKVFTKQGGNLVVLYNVYYTGNNIISKKIQLGTNTKFKCDTQTSFGLGYLDFIYLRKIVHLLKYLLSLIILTFQQLRLNNVC